MLRAQAGELAAFKIILDRYQKPLLNFFYRFFGNRAMAEDAAQQLFLQLYKSVPKYQAKSKFSTYLYRMAKNLAINISRRNSILTFFSLGEMTDPEMPPAPDAERPEAAAEKREKIFLIQRALSSLPARQRLAIVHAYFEDCSTDEIAARMDCSESAVESILFRAREKLKKFFKESGLLFALFLCCFSLLPLLSNLPLHASQVSSGNSLPTSPPVSDVGSGSAGNENQEPIEHLSEPSPVAKLWALLILPAHSASSRRLPASTPQRVESWLSALEQFPELRFTIAFSPQDYSQLSSLRSRLQALRKKGKLDAALRLDGDPPLPLIYDLDLAKIFLSPNLSFPSTKIAWPEDVTGQILKAKMDFKFFWGDAPKGFVPGGGCLNLPITEFLKNQKFQWSIAGFPETEWSEEAVLSLNENQEEPFLIFMPHPLSKLFSSGSNPSPGPDFARTASEMVQTMLKELQTTNDAISIVIFDELHSRVPLNDFLIQCAKQVRSLKNMKMISCSEAAPLVPASQKSSSLQVVPYSWKWLRGNGDPKGPGLTTWIGDPQKNIAWDLLGKAREEIERYKNSGSAVLEKLDKAMENFFLASSGDFFELFGEEQPNGASPSANKISNSNETARRTGRPSAAAGMEKKLEKELLFKEILATVYRELDLPIPDSLKRPFAPNTSSHKEEMKPDSSKIFPLQTESSGAKKEGQTGWNRTSILKRFSVESSSVSSEKDWFIFHFTLSSKFSPAPVVDLYMDVNHRAGAGASALLPGRNAQVSATDGWEFALVSQQNSSQKWECKLLRANSSVPIYKTVAAEENPSVDLPQKLLFSFRSETVAKPDEEKTDSFEVKIPKNFFGGNPARWGYLLCAVQGGNNSIVDYMDPSENKEELLSKLKAPQKNSAAANRAVLLPMIRNAGN